MKKITRGAALFFILASLGFLILSSPSSGQVDPCSQFAISVTCTEDPSRTQCEEDNQRRKAKYDQCVEDWEKEGENCCN